MVDEDEVEAKEVDSTYATKGTQNFGYKKEGMEDSSQEGGASTPARAVNTQPNANIAEISAITKKSAERRSANRRPQADNSQITSIIPTTKTIIAECTGTTPTTKIVVECSTQL